MFLLEEKFKKKIDSHERKTTGQWRGDTLDNQSEESRVGANHEPPRNRGLIVLLVIDVAKLSSSFSNRYSMVYIFQHLMKC